MHWLRQWFGSKPSPKTRRPVACRLSVEALEAREVPTLSTISSTFNGTAIPDGATVWFNSVGKISGVGADPVTIHLTQGTVTSSNFTVDVPDALITISSAITTASTTYNASTNTWETLIPKSYSGNVFLAGASLPTPDGLPGGIKPVTWQVDFTSATPGLKISWKWAAAVYTNFSTDYNALGAKPIDGSAMNPYPNSHHAGTPENFTAYVKGGARGGGGSNFTGSYSATKTVIPGQPPVEELGSISGFVYRDDNPDGVFGANEVGIQSVEVTLIGTTAQGQVSITIQTNADGSYSFTNLLPGTYQIVETQPVGYLQGNNNVGTIDGVEVGDNLTFDTLDHITLGAGKHGVNYNFGEVLQGEG